MKKVLVAAAIACAIAFTVNAAEEKKHQLTDEQKALRKEMMEKYDANKDGKLDKEEKAKMRQEDKAKMKEAFGQKKKAE